MDLLFLFGVIILSINISRFVIGAVNIWTMSKVSFGTKLFNSLEVIVIVVTLIVLIKHYYGY